MNWRRQQSNQGRRDRKGERGSILAITTMGMLSFLLIAGLAIDISHFYTAKAELQNAADASAMAAASQLNSTTGGLRSAVTEATKVLNKYDFKTDVTITPASVTFSTNLNGNYVDEATAEASAASIRFVRVTIPSKPVNVFFASIVIGPTKTISATATAGLSVGLTMNKFYTAYTFIESASTPLQRGKVYTLSAKGWNDNSPNSYRVLAAPGGDLATTGTVHAYGYIGSNYTVAQLVNTEMCRYARIGTNTRFADYTIHPQANPTDEPPDTIIQENISYQQYRDMQGNGVVQRSDGVENRRIMTLPIATSSSYNTGTREVTANRLAAFFIRRKVGADCGFEVEYIGAPIAVPDGTFQPGLSQMSELSIPVLYK